MNKFLLIILFIGLFKHSLFSISETQLKAEKAYANKDYKNAIELYNEVLKKEGTSYKLHYNLGNAYFKNNQIGYAIYNYELAGKLHPNHQDVLNNLKIANSKVIDEIQGKDNFFINAIKTGVIHAMSSTNWAILNILSLILAFLCVFCFMFSIRVFTKRLMFISAILFGLIALFSFIFGRVALKENTQSHFAIILKREVKVYGEPNESGSVKFNLHEGTRVKVIDEAPQYLNIKLDNGNEGWVKSEELGLF
jgi:tetratricopeptide (TPR) repeat protein